VNSPASVEGGASLRLFLALRLPSATVDRIAAWQTDALSHGRVVARDHLHVTLAFLGRRPAGELAAIAAELRAAAAAASRPLLRVRS
jgi:2'-5' RNA ligase